MRREELLQDIKRNREAYNQSLRALEEYDRTKYIETLIEKGIRNGDLVEIKEKNKTDWVKCFIQEPKRLENYGILNKYSPILTKIKKDSTASKVSIGIVYDTVDMFFQKWDIRKWQKD